MVVFKSDKALTDYLRARNPLYAPYGHLLWNAAVNSTEMLANAEVVTLAQLLTGGAQKDLTHSIHAGDIKAHATATATERSHEVAVHYGKRKFSLLCSRVTTLEDIEELVIRQWVELAVPVFVLTNRDIWLDQEGWNAVLRSLPEGQPISLKVVLLGKAFSKYRQVGDHLEQLALDQLDVFPNDGEPVERDDLFGTLVVGDEEETFSQMLDTLVNMEVLSLSVFKHVLGALEATHRSFILPVLVGAVAVARMVYKRTQTATDDASLWVTQESVLKGRMGWGRVDYLIWHKTLGIVVSESKKENIQQAWAQVYMEMAAMRDKLLRRFTGKANRKRSFYEATELNCIKTTAVMCTATTYQILRYTPPARFSPAQASRSAGRRASMVASSIMTIRLDRKAPVSDLKVQLRVLMLRLADMVLTQMKMMDEVLAELPHLKDLLKPDPDPAGNKVLGEESSEDSDGDDDEED